MLEKLILGNLSWNEVPWHQPIVITVDAGIVLLALSILAYLTFAKKWTYLWKEWIATVDHKKK